jgi:RNA recognition motif-containing protein
MMLELRRGTSERFFSLATLPNNKKKINKNPHKSSNFCKKIVSVILIQEARNSKDTKVLDDSSKVSPSFAGLSKGVGFIRFDQRTEAERAIQALNGTTPKQCTEPITVKFANNPSNNINKAIPPLAAYLAPAAAAANLRRFPTGPIHHIGGRFRYSPLTGDLSSTVLSANAINGSGMILIFYAHN